MLGRPYERKREEKREKKGEKGEGRKRVRAKVEQGEMWFFLLLQALQVSSKW